MRFLGRQSIPALTAMVLSAPAWSQFVLDMPAPPKRVAIEAVEATEAPPELTEAQKQQVQAGYISLAGFLFNRGTPRLSTGNTTWAQQAINQRWRAALYGTGHGSYSNAWVYPPIGWGYYPYFGGYGWFGCGGFGRGGHGRHYFDFGSSIHIGYEGDNFHFKVDL